MKGIERLHGNPVQTESPNGNIIKYRVDNLGSRLDKIELKIDDIQATLYKMNIDQLTKKASK